MRIDGTMWFESKQKDALTEGIRVAGLLIEDKSPSFFCRLAQQNSKDDGGGRESATTTIPKNRKTVNETRPVKYSEVPRALDEKHILDASIAVFAGTAFLQGILQTKLQQ